MYPEPLKQYKRGPKYGYRRYDRRYGRPEYRRRYQKDCPPCHCHKQGLKAPKDESPTPIEHQNSSPVDKGDITLQIHIFLLKNNLTDFSRQINVIQNNIFFYRRIDG